jgi:hypothetical protein
VIDSYEVWCDNPERRESMRNGISAAMTECELEEALARNSRNQDVHKMRLEIERLSELLSDSWLFVDSVARDNRLPTAVNDQAVQLLRKQQAPGWKTI